MTPRARTPVREQSCSNKNRGRPRDTRIDRAILEAAGEIILKDGIGAASMEEIAARAGTTRAAVYRRWPNRHALFVSVLAHYGQAPIPPARGRSAREDLLDLFGTFNAMVSGPLGRIGAAVVAEAIRHPAFRLQAITGAPSPDLRDEVRRRLSRALDEAGMPPDLDLEIRIDAVLGLLFMRSTVANLPPEPDLPARVLDLIIGRPHPRR